MLFTSSNLDLVADRHDLAGDLEEGLVLASVVKLHVVDLDGGALSKLGVEASRQAGSNDVKELEEVSVVGGAVDPFKGKNENGQSKERMKDQRSRKKWRRIIQKDSRGKSHKKAILKREPGGIKLTSGTRERSQ